MKVDKIKEHLPEIIALAIPLVFILGVIFFLNLPQLKADPRHDFLFSSHAEVFKINDEGLIFKDEEAIEKLARDKKERSFRKEELELEHFIARIENELSIYRYHLGGNPEEDKIEELSLEEAEKLTLLSQLNCPDGYSITHRRPERTLLGEIFGAPRVDGYYITQDNRSRKLNINRHQYSFSPWNYQIPEPPIPFIGWVAKEDQ